MVIIIKQILSVVCIIMIGWISFLFIYFVQAKQEENKSFSIYLDPGHGGYDGGCYNGTILEKDITLKVCLNLAEKLRNSGYIVFLTREKDSAVRSKKSEDLYKRVEMINKSKTNIYLSIHVNSFPNSIVHGAQVFYNDKHINNKIIAETMMKNIKIIDESNQRKIHYISGKYLVDNIQIPGCLIELGFLSNANDLNNLTSSEYLNDLSLLLLLGINEYFDYLK